MRGISRSGLSVLVCFLGGLGCSDSNGPRTPAQVVVVSGGDQSAEVLQPLAAPVVVEVRDDDGRPISGARVNWVAAEGSGTLAEATSTTDRAGRAAAVWTLGARAGTAELSAAVGALPPLTFTATAYPGAPAALQPAGGNAQAGPMGYPLREPLAVHVTDAHGNPVAWTPVTFAAAEGHGTITPAVAITNAAGRAQAVGTPGRQLGPQVATARAGAVAAPVQFTATATVDHAATLQVTITGLPAGVASDVTVRHASGYRRDISATDMLELPVSGTYTVEAREAIGGGLAFDPAVPLQTITADSGAALGAEVRYELEVTDVASGVPITGIAAPAELLRYFRMEVPEGASSLTVSTAGSNGDVDLHVRRDTARTLSGMACMSQNFDSNDACTVQRPAAGTWYILLHAYSTYSNVTLRASYVPGGSLRLEPSGLPDGATPAFTVTGADGLTQVVTSSTTLSGLVPGRYEVRADSVEAGGRVYAPSPVHAQVDVVIGATSTVPIAYAATDAGFNLSIAGMHITQATQTMDGAVPLIAGRDGLLRIFVRGSLVNTVTPDVRVRVYNGATLVDSMRLSAQVSAPMTGDGAELQSTWNYAVPAAMMAPGLAMIADVDPSNVVRESDEDDNVFPATGAPHAFDVRTAAPFAVRLVPVLQANGMIGDATDANRDSWVDMVRAVYPLPGVDVDVRAVPYSFADVLEPGGPAWPRLLQEIAALRVVDGSTRHYYGALKPAYTSGTGGMGQIGGFAAIGADWAGTRASIAAHEWGHNFGRRHAPCGGAAGADENYPHAGARLGTHGWDPRTGVMRTSDTHFDLMSYCGPTWVSDYTYRAVMDYRATAAARSSTAEPALLVWGRITADGTAILEPAIEVSAPASLPQRAGRYRLEIGDADGRSITVLSFDGVEIGHSDGERHFAFTVPLSRFDGRTPAQLHLSGPARGQHCMHAPFPPAPARCSMM